MFILAGCGNSENQFTENADPALSTSSVSDSGSPEYQNYEELNGKTISMVTGAPFEDLISSKVPNVGEFTYFASMPDMLLVVRSGKSDACLMNNAVAELAVNRMGELTLFPEALAESDFGIAFAKGDPRREDWQAAYEMIPEETKAALWEKWTGADDSVKILPAQNWEGKNGTIRVAACDTLEPMSYAGEGGSIIGFDIEMILTIAKELDVHVEITGMEFAAVLSSVQSGKADIGCGSIIVTDERKQAVDFVEYYPAAFVLIVRSQGEVSDGDSTDTITLPSQLNDPSKTVGVGVGSAYESAVREALPEASVIYYEGTDAYKAIQQEKFDAYADDYEIMRIAIANGLTGVHLLEETIGEDIPIAVGISGESKVPDLERQVNDFLDELRADGTLDDMYKRWVVDGNETMPDIPVPEHPAQHIIIGTTGVVPPYTYYSGTELNGYDIELAKRFGAWMDAEVEFKIYDYGAIVIAAHTGDVDCVMANLNVTEERKEAMLFSEPVFVNRTGLLVRDESESPLEQGFLKSVSESFEKTFLRENRWRLFIDGIGTTMLITVLSVLFGTALGFGTYMVCRNGNPMVNRIKGFAVWLVQGMPMVVLLMILYYIVFGHLEVSGTLVAIIGFTLVFGVGVYGELCVGVGAVDKGQMEGALALGYSQTKAFFRIILPQAIPHILPVYMGEIVSLLKATAIVGYIAVQDLTRMGDLVRSRTYDAFFPLIAVAVVYFILAAVLKFIIKKITICFDHKKTDVKSRLKGIVLHD